MASRDTSASQEQQYLQLIRDILTSGAREDGRNGATFVRFGHMMRFSLRDGALPLLTTKRVAWRTCFRELMWFVRGQTDAEILKDQNVHIWTENGTREFLDGRGLTEYPAGTLGPVYGFQWRHFGAEYDPEIAGPAIDRNSPDRNSPYIAGNRMVGIDQLQNVVDMLKDPAQRSSRRILMSSWNPVDLDKMALPPCHVLAQFHVRGGQYLSCALYQRSCDVGLGVPFNIASYAFLTHVLANLCGLHAEELVYFMGNAHIYEDHADQLREQTERTPLPFPAIHICAPGPDKRIEDYDEKDIEFIAPYEYLADIKLKMVA